MFRRRRSQNKNNRNHEVWDEILSIINVINMKMQIQYGFYNVIQILNTCNFANNYFEQLIEKQNG